MYCDPQQRCSYIVLLSKMYTSHNVYIWNVEVLKRGSVFNVPLQNVSVHKKLMLQDVHCVVNQMSKLQNVQNHKTSMVTKRP